MNEFMAEAAELLVITPPPPNSYSRLDNKISSPCLRRFNQHMVQRKLTLVPSKFGMGYTSHFSPLHTFQFYIA